MVGNSLSHTDSFINVIVIRIRPSSHHHIILSLAKCLLFMDISWGAGDEVMVAMLWLMPLDLS